MVPSSVDQDRLNLRPKKFLMWLFIITSFMLFAALTSGFIVYTAGDPSRGIKMILPKLFLYSSIAIVASSVTMHLAYGAAKKLQFSRQRLFLAITIVLGILFFVMQLLSWRGLIENGVYFVNPNASQSFLYVLTGAHLLHIFAGLIVLLTSFAGTFKSVAQVKNVFRMEMAAIFWHFLDILWIYLYVFLLLNQ
ncbi:cytochrome c oxidase subunit 3 [Pedobacter sp. SYSU D00535]|uniref:cytochrome c oxidase subunit 3 n=1 Tax=Pedobacter sp. SYSU D00535 TaxID=2810308 RepID=UPI001F622ADC|nr:cytochrome c oxidase subunit 3 [Pedobacter sp. SYSU D00535]